MAQTFGFNAARKRYKRVFWPAMASYCLIVAGGVWYVDKGVTPPWIASLVAIATALPVCVALWAIVRWMLETDEYTRMRHLKAFAYGAALVISAIFVVGFLQIFEVIGNVEVFWFGPAFFIAYGLFNCVPMLFGKTV
ncbi:hypothetical protein [Henriciella litoralis]|uniref:hypothetical protein n=1 Tax=Henriciella litoralis TaxID=568102 RepID=UPI000A07B34A|nr:hypothetical protein [Henriciella litoralis]